MNLNKTAVKAAFELRKREITFEAFCDGIRKGMQLLQRQLDEEKEGLFVSRMFSKEETAAYVAALEYQNEIETKGAYISAKFRKEPPVQAPTMPQSFFDDIELQRILNKGDFAKGFEDYKQRTKIDDAIVIDSVLRTIDRCAKTIKERTNKSAKDDADAAQSLRMIEDFKQWVTTPEMLKQYAANNGSNSKFSVMEWATIFYYADLNGLLPKTTTKKKRLEEFIRKHKLTTTFNTLKNERNAIKNRIDKTKDYPIDKLNKILPFMKQHYPKTIENIKEDIELIENESFWKKRLVKSKNKQNG